MTNVKLVSCANGHRSTVPHDAIEFDLASTHTCPVCGLGVTRKNFETVPEKREPVPNTSATLKYRPLWSG